MARLGPRLCSQEHCLGSCAFHVGQPLPRRDSGLFVKRPLHRTPPPPVASSFNRRGRPQKPGLFEVMVLGPPARSLGVQELEPNVHNGDCISVQDTDYLVQALSIRFKLVKGRYQRDHSKVEVKSASRYFVERNLESALQAAHPEES